MAAKLQGVTLYLALLSAVENSIVNYSLTFKRLLEDAMKHFMPVNMAIYVKLLPDWYQKRIENLNCLILKKLNCFISLPTKKTLLANSFTSELFH